MFSCNAVGGEIVVKQGEIGENFYVIEQVVIVTTIVIVMITIFVVFMATIMVVVMTTVLVIALTTMIAIMMPTVRSSTYLSNLTHDDSSQGQATIQVGEPSGKQVVNIAVGEGGSFGELALIYGEIGIMVKWSW